MNRKISAAAAAVAAGLACAALSPRQARADFIPVTGTPDYNLTANWDGGTINGAFSRTLTAAMTVVFNADTTLGTGWSLNYDGAFNTTFRGNGANRTVTLGGDVSVDSVTNARTISIGSTTAAQNLNLNLNATRTFNVAAGDAVDLINLVADGAGDNGLIKEGAGVLRIRGANTFGAVNGAGTTLRAGTLSIDSQGTANTNSSVGLGVLTLEGGTMRVDAGASGAKTVWNPLSLAGNVGFGDATSNFTLTFSGPATLTGTRTLSAANTLTTFSGVIGDGGNAFGITKAGAGTLALTGANTFAGPTAVNAGAVRANSGAGLPTASNLTLDGGVLESAGGATFARALGTGAGQVQFGPAGGGFAGGSGALTVNLGGNATPDTVVWASTPNFLAAGAPLTLGSATSAAAVNFSNPIDLNAAARTINVLDNAGSGADVATISGAITGANASLVKAGPGTLVLTSAGNSYTGSTAVSGGALRPAAGALPAASNLVLSGGVYEGTGAATFALPLGAGGGQVRWGGNGGFAANGGKLTVQIGGNSNPLAWGQADFVQPGSALLFGSATADNETDFTHPIDLNAATRTVTTVDNPNSAADFANLTGALSNGSLTVTGNGVLNLSTPSTITNLTAAGGTVRPNAGAGTLTVTGDLLVGANGTTGSLTGLSGSLSVGSGAANTILIGSDSANVSPNSNGNANLSGLTSFTANVGTIRVGAPLDTAAGTGIEAGTLTLAPLSMITASTSILVGDSNGDGGSATRAIVFGSGTNDVTTPLMTIGGRKYSGTATIAPGGTLLLDNGAGRTTLNVGTNTAAGTGTQPVASMSLAGGSLVATLGQTTVALRDGGGAAGRSTGTLDLGTSAATNVNIGVATGAALRVGTHLFGGGTQPTSGQSTGTVVVGGGTVAISSTDASAGNAAVVLGDFTATAAVTAGTNTAGGTLTINGGDVTVTTASPTAIALARRTGTFTGSNTSTGVLTIAGGSLTVNGAITGGNVAGQQTSTLTLSGGLLNLQGNNLGGLTTLAFTGGTLRNPGTVAQPLTQNGAASALEAADNSGTIAGDYTLTAGAARANLARTLTVTGNAAVASAGTFATTLADPLSPGAPAGRLAVANLLDLSAAGETLRVTDPTGGSAFDGVTTYTLATYGTVNGVFDNVVYNNGSTDTAGVAAQAAAPGLFPGGYKLTYEANSLTLSPTIVPEPSSLALAALSALPLLRRRQRRLR